MNDFNSSYAIAVIIKFFLPQLLFLYKDVDHQLNQIYLENFEFPIISLLHWNKYHKKQKRPRQTSQSIFFGFYSKIKQQSKQTKNQKLLHFMRMNALRNYYTL